MIKILIIILRTNVPARYIFYFYFYFWRAHRVYLALYVIMYCISFIYLKECLKNKNKKIK